MNKNAVESPFAKGLAANYQANILPEERKTHERTLGEGAIKFKLAPGGMRKLMAALDAEQQEAENG